MTTRQHYDRLREGALEYTTDPKPMNADAVKARRQAIREGRLRVVDRNNQEDSPSFNEECLGCEAEPPQWDYSVPLPGAPPLAPRPMTPGSGGSYTGTFTSFIKPHAYGNDAEGNEFDLHPEKLTVVPKNGSCKTVEEVCQENTSCSFDVELSFGGYYDGPGSNLPNIDISTPFTGVQVFSMGPENIVNQGDSSTCEYVLAFTVTVACGTSVAGVFDDGSMALQPDHGFGFHPFFGSIALALSCKQCGGDPAEQ